MGHASRAGMAGVLLLVAASASRGEDPVPPKAAPPGPMEIVVAADGSGTHKTIAGGLAAAEAGAKVTVKPALYLESVELRKPVTLVAAKGAGRVVLKAPDGTTALTVSADAVVEGFFLQGAGAAAENEQAVLVTGVKLVLRGCEVSAPKGWGLIARKSAISLESVTVQDCRATGVFGAEKSTVEISGGVVRRCGGTGVRLEGESELTASKVEISGNERGNLSFRSKSKGVVSDCRSLEGKASGILVEEDAALEGTNLEVARNATSGVEVRQGGRVLLTGCNLRANKEAGVWAHHKGQVIVKKCLFEGNEHDGLVAEDEGTSADALECRFMDGKAGGIYLCNSGKVLAEKCEINGNNESGLRIESGAEATVHDCRMTKNKEYGVAAMEGARGKVDKCDLRGNVTGTIYRDPISKVEFKGNREK